VREQNQIDVTLGQISTFDFDKAPQVCTNLDKFRFCDFDDLVTKLAGVGYRMMDAAAFL